MADVKIRKLDDSVLAAYRARAAAAGRSLEEELRLALADNLERDRRLLFEEIEAFQRHLLAKYGEMPDSTPLLRELREEGE